MPLASAVYTIMLQVSEIVAISFGLSATAISLIAIVVAMRIGRRPERLRVTSFSRLLEMLSTPCQGCFIIALDERRMAHTRKNTSLKLGAVLLSERSKISHAKMNFPNFILDWGLETLGRGYMVNLEQFSSANKHRQATAIFPVIKSTIAVPATHVLRSWVTLLV
ncbi:hypothetical protein VTL71DRAFT_15650 [Oculimacula yallundae]|uniref:Uncharacterized protein n=1 Tax=Oculimacula yallundae TaxID=86028 RepID=A0ABR4CHY1_9HELO